MKFHRICGGIFSSFLREKLKTTNTCEARKGSWKKFLKKLKKVVDMRMTVCYINKAVAKNNSDEPWKLNSNAISKIL